MIKLTTNQKKYLSKRLDKMDKISQGEIKYVN